MSIPLITRWLGLAILPLSLFTISALAADAPSSYTTTPPLIRRIITPAQPADATPKNVDKNVAPAETEKASYNEETQPIIGVRPVDVFELPEIDVVGNTPLGATGLELKKSPAMCSLLRMRKYIVMRQLA